MKIVKFIRYFIEFIFFIIFFVTFKILGIKISTIISEKIFTYIGPCFRSKKIISNNLKKAFKEISNEDIKKEISKMWGYYGKIFAEYSFLNNFRNKKMTDNIEVVGQEILIELNSKNENVIFVSGHFDNFELMAMTLDKKKIKLAAIYRPLNNYFINNIMVYLRKKYICKTQIKKGRSSVRNLLDLFKQGFSIALMIDQRVSEGIKSNFFGDEALTTTIPAQFVKKFNCKVVPLCIERRRENNFKIKIFTPIKFERNDSVEKITQDLNFWLEKMIKDNNIKWIWSHNRWK